MEEIKMLIEEANRAFKTADHLTYTTYPLLKETKILILIIEQLYNSLSKGMEAVLEYDYLYKRIQQYPNDFQGRLHVFRNYSMNRYNFSRETAALLEEIHEIIIKRKTAPIEFPRKDKFVIASDTFRLKSISIDKVKQFVTQTKKFIDKLNEVYRASDRRFS